MNKLTFGFARLETILKTEGGCLTIVAGEPGGRKTSLLISMAVSAAKAGSKVLFISTEYHKDDLKTQVDRRFAGAEGRERLIDISLVSPNYEAITAAVAEHYIEDTDCDAIFIDSINTMMHKEKFGDKASYAYNSHKLFNLGIKLARPIIASASIPPKASATPKMLKDFGPVLSVTESSDTILLVEKAGPIKVDLHVLRNRHGVLASSYGNPINEVDFIEQSPFVMPAPKAKDEEDF